MMVLQHINFLNGRLRVQVVCLERHASANAVLFQIIGVTLARSSWMQPDVEASDVVMDTALRVYQGGNLYGFTYKHKCSELNRSK